MVDESQHAGQRQPSAQADDAAQPAWSAYQEEVASFFRELGLGAETNVRLEGARGIHDVDDVTVRDRIARVRTALRKTSVAVS